ncbi:MAG: hypothetical protein JWO62_2483 [Acidimicrobiaceae bacterium]|jgi:anti-anti-sigma factor|nr:hypothetical protein [Acidimicrobiaceae bacterium]
MTAHEVGMIGPGPIMGVAPVGDGASAVQLLTITLDDFETVCVLKLRGVLRDTSIAALEAQIDQLACTRCDSVVVDLDELTAIDTVGINVLTGLGHYVRGLGGHLELIGARGQVAEVIEDAARETSC